MTINVQVTGEYLFMVYEDLARQKGNIACTSLSVLFQTLPSRIDCSEGVNIVHPTNPHSIIVPIELPANSNRFRSIDMAVCLSTAWPSVKEARASPFFSLSNRPFNTSQHLPICIQFYIFKQVDAQFTLKCEYSSGVILLVYPRIKHSFAHALSHSGRVIIHVPCFGKRNENGSHPQRIHALSLSLSNIQDAHQRGIPPVIRELALCKNSVILDRYSGALLVDKHVVQWYD